MENSLITQLSEMGNAKLEYVGVFTFPSGIQVQYTGKVKKAKSWAKILSSLGLGTLPMINKINYKIEAHTSGIGYLAYGGNIWATSLTFDIAEIIFRKEA